MIITRQSPITGEVNQRDLPVTAEQMARFVRRDENIQNIFPDLSADDREFILTGMTKEDWDSLFNERGEEE